MPLQSTFGLKVGTTTSDKKHPLGTVRIERNKIYKYVKAGGSNLDSLATLMFSASGTVVLNNGTGKGAGMNTTGATVTAAYYFWMQVSGEVTGLDTTTGTPAAGALAGITSADGVTFAAIDTGVVQFGSSVFNVVDGSAGVVTLCGLL